MVLDTGNFGSVGGEIDCHEWSEVHSEKECEELACAQTKIGYPVVSRFRTLECAFCTPLLRSEARQTPPSAHQ